MSASLKQAAVTEGNGFFKREYVVPIVTSIISTLIVALVLWSFSSISKGGADGAKIEQLSNEQNYIRQRVDRIYEILVDQRK
jgi:hypothetical protein